jgi:predicted alpha/beta superfamily hydrolase
MNILKSLKLVITTILLFICSTIAFGQKLAPKERILAPDQTITSTITGKDYQLYLSFPKNYSTKDSITYPVLYVLDGMNASRIISGIRPLMHVGNQLEDVIIVGIGSGLDPLSWYNNRYNDYTTSVSIPKDETIRDKANGLWGKKFDVPKGNFKSGGAAKFLKIIKTEIAPYLDKNYKTNADRGITGHSLGGLFTAYCLVNSDGYFTRFGINSPALWWDNEKLLNQAVAQFTENKIWDLPQTKVFISVGDQEDSFMVPTMTKFSKYLEDSNYENIDLKWKIFDGENHISVIPASLSKTIYTLYGKDKRITRP